MNLIPTPTDSSGRLPAQLAALSHPARLAIVRHLGNGCCCCKDVVVKFDLAQSTISQHLKILVDAGLVTLTVDRHRSLYRVDATALAEAAAGVAALAQACCDGSGTGCSVTDGGLAAAN